MGQAGVAGDPRLQLWRDEPRQLAHVAVVDAEVSSVALAWVAERNSQQAIGTLEHVQQRIADLVEVTRADEVIVVPQGPDLDTKLATLRSLV